MIIFSKMKRADFCCIYHSSCKTRWFCTLAYFLVFIFCRLRSDHSDVWLSRKEELRKYNFYSFFLFKYFLLFLIFFGCHEYWLANMRCQVVEVCKEGYEMVGKILQQLILFSFYFRVKKNVLGGVTTDNKNS